MTYSHVAIPDDKVPRSVDPVFQHALETYASETNKVLSVWSEFADAHFSFHPHPRSSSIGEIMTHQLLSERRFFAEFLGAPEPAASQVLPEERRVLDTSHHRTQLTVYLRLLEKSVPPTYGPTADVTWRGADPTLTVEAADRR